VLFILFVCESYNATPVAHRADALLYGKNYTHDQAFSAGIFRELAPDQASVVKTAVDVATVLPTGSANAFALVKGLMTEDAVKYCKTRGPAIMEQVMGCLYSDEGWKQIQTTLSAMAKKK
jgi:enoyl-CoA hydratase/carnithine racemase